MNPQHFLITKNWGCTQRACKPNEIIVEEYTKMYESRVSAGATEKLPGWEKPSRKNSRVVPRHGRSCSKMRWEILRAGTQNGEEQSYKVWSPCLERITTSRRKNLNQLENYQKYAHKLSWNACMVCQQTCKSSHKMDATGVWQYWFHTFITQMTTDTIFMWATRLSIVDWVFFRDPDFAGDPEDSISTSGGVLCIFGSRTYVSISWMCKKQTSVSHSSTESEIISLDAGLRMDGPLALDLWDAVIEVLRSTNSTKRPIRVATGNHSSNKTMTTTPTSVVSGNKDRERSNRDVDQLSHVDYVLTFTFFSRPVSVVHLWR